MLQTLFLASGGGTHVPDELILVIAMAVLMAVVLHSLRLPVITGLLLAGALIGPNGFQWVGHENETSIQMLSEIGLIMLMFTIGLEFSLKKLMKAWRLVLIGGALQAVLTGALAIGVSMAVGLPFAGAAVIAMIVIMSSTAIVLRGLTERGELDAPHGRFIVGVLIFQDLLVVPFMLMVPLLIPHEGGEPLPLAMLRVAGMTIGVVLVIILSTRAIVPRLFRIVANTRSREVFVLAVVAVCTGTAWVTQQLGLSMALGAFLAGMVLADSDFGNRAIGDMLPLRDVLTSVFFVSLGMLFQANAVIDHPVTVLLILVALVVGKTIIATIAALAMKFPARVAWLAGVGLAQLSEFGVVLAGMSEAQQLVPRDVMSPLLAAGVMSMFLTPLMIRLAPHVTAGERVLRRLERILGVRGVDDRGDFAHKELEDHVVVVGYGVGGKLICRALRDSDVPYIVLELNAGTVRAARATEIGRA
ncbi:MAG: cation:proton antiporter, partial [Planctomycetota bacterium]